MTKQEKQVRKDKIGNSYGNYCLTWGIEDFAEEHQCHWLMTDIWAYSIGIKEPMLFWTLDVVPSEGLNTGRLYCVRDTGEPPLYEVNGIHTDMPAGSFRIWSHRTLQEVKPGVIKEITTIFLPSEY